MSTSNIILTVASVVLALILLCSAQNFDPELSDKEYLDKIQDQLHKEVMVAHTNLVNQTKILQQVTRSFIASKIKENLFRVSIMQPSCSKSIICKCVAKVNIFE